MAGKISWRLVVPGVFLFLSTIVHLICTYRYIDFWEGGFDYGMYLSGVNEKDQLRIATMYAESSPGQVSQMFPRTELDNVLYTMFWKKTLEIGAMNAQTTVPVVNIDPQGVGFLTSQWAAIQYPTARDFIGSTLLSAGPMFQTFVLFIAAFPAGPATMLYSMVAIYYAVKLRRNVGFTNAFIVFSAIIFIYNTIQFGFACRLLQYARKVTIEMTASDLSQYNDQRTTLAVADGVRMFESAYPTFVATPTSYTNAFKTDLQARYRDLYTSYLSQFEVAKTDADVRLAPVEYGMAVIAILMWIFHFIFCACLLWALKTQGELIATSTSLPAMPPPAAITDVKLDEN